MKKVTTLLICLSMLFLHSCQDDQYNNEPGHTKGTVARFNLHLPDYTQVGTRATNESAITDVTILQFINGTLAKKIIIDDKFWGAAVETTELEGMPASKLDESGKLVTAGDVNVMVFLANFKEKFGTYLTGLSENSTTYAAFQAMNTSLANAQALADLQYMPMTGFYYGGITTGITNQINVSLTRSLAKINFTLNTANFQVDGKSTTVIVNSIELHNVPLDVTLFESNRPSLPSGTQPGSWTGTPKLYPTYNASKFVNLDATQNQSATPLTNFVAYMPENVRGSYTGITSNKDKHPDAVVTPGIPAGNKDGWPYIYVDLNYSNVDGLSGNAKYRIYLGGDAAGDINILSNVQYNVTTNLYGIGDSDTRITATSDFDPRPSDAAGANTGIHILDMANSYIINNTSLEIDSKPLVLPLTQARKGWQYIENKLADGTKYVGAFDQMIVAGNWEIITLWKTQNSDTQIKGVQEEITTKVAGNGAKYYAKLSTIDTAPVLGSNYVIALVNKTLFSASDGKTYAANTIWWSWHLWFTDYKPDPIGASTTNGQTHTYISDAFGIAGRYRNAVMMDRNLGATGSVSGTNVIGPSTFGDGTSAGKWYGLMYQWGKKDPYTSTEGAGTGISDATPIYNSAGGRLQGATAWGTLTDNSGITLAGNATNSVDGFPKVPVDDKNRLVDIIRMPYVYFYSGKDNSWTNDHYNDIWGFDGTNLNSKTPFDPCPPGWRVSVGGTTVTNNVWAGFADGKGSLSPITNAGQYNKFAWWNNGAEVTTGNSVTAGRRYTDNDKSGTPISAWYPASGSRSSTTGAFGNVGSYGYSWAASATATNGYYLSFNSGSVYPQNNNNRAFGFPVRCISE